MIFEGINKEILISASWYVNQMRESANFTSNKDCPSQS